MKWPLFLALLLCLCSVGSARGQIAIVDPDQPEPPAEEFFDPFEEEDAIVPLKVWDPLEPVNRVFFVFNDRLYFWVLRPAAKGYSRITPRPARRSVSRFFTNLRYPIRGVNNLLQGKFKGAGVETARFVVNSTFGVAGLFDPARSKFGLEPFSEDLDQTLGFYRVGPGFYIHWPITGPASVRSSIARIGDSYLNLWSYVDLDGYEVRLAIRAFRTVNETSLRLGEYEDFKKNTFDPYVALRNAYYQHRQKLVAE